MKAQILKVHVESRNSFQVDDFCVAFLCKVCSRCKQASNAGQHQQEQLAALEIDYHCSHASFLKWHPNTPRVARSANQNAARCDSFGECTVITSRSSP